MKKFISTLAMVFAVAFTVMLVSGTTSKALTTWNANVQQTGAGENKVELQWDTYLGAGHYEIMFSYDNVNWTYMDYSTQPSVTIYDLSSAATYYVRVLAYSESYYSNDKVELAESEPIDVVTSPAEVTNLKQSGATTTSISLTWTAIANASAYRIYRYDSYASQILIGTSKKNSYTITGLTASSSARYYVAAVRENSLGQAAIGSGCSSVEMRTAPAKVSYVKITSYYSSIKVAYYGWNSVNNADGYEFQIYNYKGKKILDKETTSSSIRIDPVKTGMVTKARSRAYIVVDNKKVYGAWSSYSYSASCNSLKVSSSSRKIRLKWSKVKGASGYRIYAATSSSGKYKKIKALKANKTSYTFNKVGGKRLQKNKTYYIRIKYLLKAGKKTVVSPVRGEGYITVR